MNIKNSRNDMTELLQERIPTTNNAMISTNTKHCGTPRNDSSNFFFKTLYSRSPEKIYNVQYYQIESQPKKYIRYLEWTSFSSLELFGSGT